jgi:hypothetical protein
MSERGQNKRALREKAVDEFKEFIGLSAYLYICLGALLLFKSAILEGAGIEFAVWGIAAVKAMVLAKFMLVGRMLGIGVRFRDKPLIWPTIYHALMSLFVLLILTTAEELILGLIHGRTLADSLSHVVGPTAFQGLAVCLVMFLVLTPYAAFVSLGDAVGEVALFRLFFVTRSAGAALRDRLAENRG